MPRARCRGPSPAASPARVPPVPQATATTSAAAAQLLAERLAAAYGERVAAALRDDVRVLGARRAQDRASVRARSCGGRSTVDEVQPHAVGRAPGERGVSGRSASSSPRTTPTVGRPRRRPGGGGGAQMVRVGARRR